MHSCGGPRGAAAKCRQRSERLRRAVDRQPGGASRTFSARRERATACAELQRCLTAPAGAIGGGDGAGAAMPTCGTVAASPETHSACALIGWCTQPRVAGQLDSHSEGLLHRCSLDSRSPLPCLPPPPHCFGG